MILNHQTSLRMHKLFGHLSVAALTFSVLFNHNFSESVDIKVSEGDQMNLLNSKIFFEKVEIVTDSNFNGVRAKFVIDEEYPLLPEKRVYKVGGQITSETAVNSTFLKDYLIVLGDRFQDGLMVSNIFKEIWYFNDLDVVICAAIVYILWRT